jgi:hypothetical protein
MVLKSAKTVALVSGNICRKINSMFDKLVESWLYQRMQIKE